VDAHPQERHSTIPSLLSPQATQEEIPGETPETEDPETPEILETAAVRREALSKAWLRWISTAEALLRDHTPQIQMDDARTCEDHLHADLRRSEAEADTQWAL
jgi:hypothetical protein